MQENPEVSLDFRCGSPDECSEFGSRHQAFVAVKPKLERLFEKLLARPKLQSDADKAVFFLGLLAVQDFNELLLLAANGYGTGALKLLRVLYEHAVNELYIHKHAEEAEPFFLSHDIRALTNFERGKEFWGTLEVFSDSEHQKLKQKCGRGKHLDLTSRRSWSQLDLLSMAKKADPQLAELYAPCADLPNFEIHASSTSILARVERAPSGMEVTTSQQSATADGAFELAWILLGFALHALNEHFQRSLETEIKEVLENST